MPARKNDRIAVRLAEIHATRGHNDGFPKTLFLVWQTTVGSKKGEQVNELAKLESLVYLFTLILFYEKLPSAEQTTQHTTQSTTLTAQHAHQATRIYT